MLRAFFGVVVFVTLVESTTPSTVAQPATSAATSPVAAISDFLAETYPADEPGAAIIIVDDGELLLRQAYGMAHLELGVPLEPDMVFRLGSITKQFTAAAILLLAEDGELSLDDAITDYLPDYPVGDHVVTVEHLLTHTSGIFSYTSIPGYMGNPVRRDLTTDELVDAFKDQPMEFAPGERWSYSNSGYVLLGAIVERASGMSYAEFVRMRLFEPLAMSDSWYGGHQIIPRRVAGYDGGENGLVNAAYLSMTQPHAAGSLLSTVDDLVKWDAALHGGKLLSADSYRKMTTPYELKSGELADYGYGVSLSTFRGRPVIQHGGGIFGFSTFAVRIPEEDLFVAVLSNNTARELSPGPVALKIAAMAIGDPLPDFERTPVDAAKLQNLVGVYKIADGGERTVVFENGQLLTQRTGGPRLEAIPAGDDTFFYDGSMTYFKIANEANDTVMLMFHDGTDDPERAIRTSTEVRTREEIKVDPALLADYPGRYELGPGFLLTVTLENGQLMTQATGQEKFPVFAATESRFFLKVVDAEIEFQRDNQGKVVSLMLFQGGREMPAKRLD